MRKCFLYYCVQLRIMRKSVILSATFVLLSCSCNSVKKIKGTWSDQQGQTFVFQENNKALWIFNTERLKDTFKITYTYKKKSPYSFLDLSGFTSGPLSGRTLYGIAAFTSGSVKLDFEPGKTDSVRPKEFNPKQVKEYFKQ